MKLPSVDRKLRLKLEDCNMDEKASRRPRGPSAFGNFEQSKRSAMESTAQEKAAQRAKSARLRSLREAQAGHFEPENSGKGKADL
ncbi:hypothetical protein [Rhizobium sp. Leaf391]|uniref:hypothetical protein n=1 Tax=Rhizobium sp. Leaf391 TaxID=1736360 RepID=UPI001AECB07A|nr:hypothetical protein [Rhizobium sp. Leaf391]